MINSISCFDYLSKNIYQIYFSHQRYKSIIHYKIGLEI